MTTSDDAPNVQTCHGGREVKRLNTASDEATCVGCGDVPELGTCEPNA